MFDFKQFLTPFCAVCNKEVDRVEWEQDFCTMTIYAKAFCHGDTEVSSVTTYLMKDAQISQGVAFMNKKIDPNDIRMSGIEYEK